VVVDNSISYFNHLLRILNHLLLDVIDPRTTLTPLKYHESNNNAGIFKQRESLVIRLYGL
jgi:hypothetical protein